MKPLHYLTLVLLILALVSLQTEFCDGAMDTLTVTFVFSTIVTEFDVAGFPVGQGTLEFRIQVTISPLVGM